MINISPMKKIIQASLILCLILSPLQAMAAGDGEMAIYPHEWDGENELTKHWFLYDLGPGATHEDKVTVENLGDSDLSLKIYAVDALTTSDGAFALENEDENKDDIGAWVSVSENELALGAKEKKAVAFTITIPEDASPGEHIGGIVIENADVQEGELLNLKTRVGVRIYETVPGDIVKKLSMEEIEVEGFYESIWSLFYNWKAKLKLVNEGNVQAAPIIDIALTSAIFGEVMNSSQALSGTVFPNKSIEQAINIEDTLYFGPYTLTITATEEGGNPIQKSVTFWALPWKLGLIVVVVLLALWSLLYMGSHEDNEEAVDPFVIAEDTPKRKAKRKTSTKKKKVTKKKKK